MARKSKSIAEDQYLGLYCPSCKGELKNSTTLEVNVLYKCKNCSEKFFIVKSPKEFFVI